MTIVNGSPYWLMVDGVWKHLEGVDPGVEVSKDRPSSEFRTLGNVRYVQVARKALRAWGLSFRYEDAEASRWLDYAASNPAGTYWLCDVNLSQINALAPTVTKGSSATTVLVDGVPMRTFAASQGFTFKVRAGVSYSLSYTTTHTAGATVGTYNLGSGAVNIVAPAGTGARRGSVAFQSVSDATVTVVWTVANVTTAARLAEGSVDTLGFLEGRNAVCRVSVGDGSATYQMAWDDRLALADSAYVLTEVG